jgi:uncharacterized membrane protein
MTPEWIGLAVCVGMGVVTLATRIGGVWAMDFIPITRRVETFLRHMASSVIVAIVVGGAARGDTVANVALATSIVVMVATRQTYLALTAAMVVAAAIRLVWPPG